MYIAGSCVFSRLVQESAMQKPVHLPFTGSRENYAAFALSSHVQETPEGEARLIVGIDSLSTQHVVERYRPVLTTGTVIPMTAENTSRDLPNVTVKNEEITRFPLRPGAGVGSHCLTEDSWRLERGVQVCGRSLDWPESREFLYALARGINNFVSQHMLRLIESALAQRSRPLASLHQ